MKKEKGNMADIVAAGLCMLAMTVVMLAYMQNAGAVRRKAQVDQIARKYILRMETEGRLSDPDRILLIGELRETGLSEIDLGGTTFNQAGYGEEIVLQIRGILEGEYEIREKRVSTAKH